MKRKKSKRKIIIIIIITVMLFIALMVTISILRKKTYREERERVLYEEVYTDYYEGKYFPDGISRFKFLYQDSGGKLSQDEYYEQLYAFTNYLIELNKTIKKNINLDDYYENNKNAILKNTGIVSKDYFTKMVELLKSIDVDDLGEYQNSQIMFDSFIDDGKACIFTTKIIFTNFEQGISVKTFFYKINNNINSETNKVYFEIYD